MEFVQRLLERGMAMPANVGNEREVASSVAVVRARAAANVYPVRAPRARAYRQARRSLIRDG